MGRREAGGGMGRRYERSVSRVSREDASSVGAVVSRGVGGVWISDGRSVG